MTKNPETNLIMDKDKTIEQKKGSYYKRLYAEWNKEQRNVKEL